LWCKYTWVTAATSAKDWILDYSTDSTIYWHCNWKNGWSPANWCFKCKYWYRRYVAIVKKLTMHVEMLHEIEIIVKIHMQKLQSEHKLIDHGLVIMTLARINTHGNVKQKYVRSVMEQTDIILRMVFV
jgi:hypothetical protein